MHRYTIEVGWTSTRPIRPDEHRSTFVIMAESGHAAELCALQWAASRPTCEMPTSSIVIDWEEGSP
ncbi:MAG: hypothetical protein ABIQ39_02080 [Ilumatobacteraceae bacterium]